MKGMRKGMMTGRMPKMPGRMPPAMPGKNQMMRHEPNHNVHVMTHHGKVQIGRKGRTGNR